FRNPAWGVRSGGAAGRGCGDHTRPDARRLKSFSGGMASSWEIAPILGLSNRITLSAGLYEQVKRVSISRHEAMARGGFGGALDSVGAVPVPRPRPSRLQALLRRGQAAQGAGA